jgi:hypothetical protein
MNGKTANTPREGRRSPWAYLRIGAVLLLPFAASSPVVFRAADVPQADLGFIVLAFLNYVLLGASMVTPRMYEIAAVALVYLWLVFRGRRRRPLPAGIAFRLAGRVLLGYAVLRIGLVLALAAGLTLYRTPQAASSVFLALSLLLLVTTIRKRPSSRWTAVVALAAAVFLVGLVCALREYPVQPFEIVVGANLGLLGWLLLFRSNDPSPARTPAAWRVLTWYAAILVLAVPDLLLAYLAFHAGLPRAQWIDSRSSGAYDAATSPDGTTVFSAQGAVIRYDLREPPVRKTAETDVIGAQRLALDNDRGILYAPAFDPSAPIGPDDADVYGYDLNLRPSVRVKYPNCRRALYVQYSPRWRRMYYTCEDSGYLVEFAPADGRSRALGRYYSPRNLCPNHLQIGEREDTLLVFPVLGTGVPVFALPEGRLVRRIPVVPPVYGSAEDTRRKVLVLARFMLGDLELRDNTTFRVVGHIRADLGPRDLDIDRAGGRVFTCSYFFGTLCIADVDRRTVTRLYAGVRARGVHYDAATGRLYFSSPLGLGYYDEDALRNAYRSGGVLADLRELLRIARDREDPMRLREFASFFTLLASPHAKLDS